MLVVFEGLRTNDGVGAMMDDGAIVVAVFDHQTSRLGTSFDIDAATTLIAVASEDPSSWDEVVGYWPRYRTPAVCEFADGLPMRSTKRGEAIAAVAQSEAWVVIDLVAKRIVTGGQIDPVGRDQAFSMVTGDDGKQHFPVSVHLPPWWELFEQAEFDAIDQPRQSPLEVPQPNREVLFGKPMLGHLADHLLATVSSKSWRTSGAATNDRVRYRFTVEVHRDWLMTPREDLGGQTPRQMLHGAHDWIDQLVWAQRIRFEDGGEIVAAPNDSAGFETAPMGREEMVVYFDLCRELIQAGWSWCRKKRFDASSDRSGLRAELIEFLTKIKRSWLSSPFEDDSPPEFIIECSRRRVPRGVGVPIVGMSTRQTADHMSDCDCPICSMMSEGLFGPGFIELDGHHLDLDDEFAFSMHQSREEWESQQQHFAAMSEAYARQVDEDRQETIDDPDEFSSVWSAGQSDEPIPGDSQGHLKLAFLLAEVVSVLESNGVSSAEIRQLNANFTDFRNCDADQLVESGRRLGDQLQSLADRHSQLVPRVADFRSRIDEQIRAATAISGDEPY